MSIRKIDAVKLRVARWVLPRVLQSPCPATSDEMVWMDNVDCYSVYVCKNDEAYFMVESIGADDVLSGRAVKESIFGESGKLNPEKWLADQLISYRRLRWSSVHMEKIKFNGVLQLALGYMLPIEYLVRRIRWMLRTNWRILWNTAKPVTENRVKLLKKILDFHIKVDRGVLLEQLLPDIPYDESRVRKMELILDSLVESGELAKDPSGPRSYVPTPKAVQTVAQHKERVWGRIIWVFVTLLAALLAGLAPEMLTNLYLMLERLLTSTPTSSP